jgi:hypothetical protein
MAVLLLLLVVAVTGDGNTPVLGKQIAAFQGHHQRPWTITQREFANNVHQVSPAAYTTLVRVHKCAEAFVRPHAHSLYDSGAAAMTTGLVHLSAGSASCLNCSS